MEQHSPTSPSDHPEQEQQTPELTGPSGFLDSCRYLAQHLAAPQLAARLESLREPEDPEARPDFFNKVLNLVREARLRPNLVHLQWSNLPALPERLPVIVELQNGQYCLLVALGQGQAGLLDPSRPGAQPESFSLDAFRKMWTGHVLLFEKVNTALICFSLIAKEHKIEVTPERLLHEYGLSWEEIPTGTLLRMAKDAGLKAKIFKGRWKDLGRLKKAWPALARLKNGASVVLVGMTTDQDGTPLVGVYDPLHADGHLRLTEQEFTARWGGELCLLKRLYKISDENQPFSLRWFIPEFLRQKVTFFDVGLAVLFINLIALVTPLFFQIVIDKVLVNQAFTTLQVLGIGMTVALAVGAGLDFLRDYLLLHATNKIDLRVTSRTFRHLLNLPLDFLSISLLAC